MGASLPRRGVVSRPVLVTLVLPAGHARAVWHSLCTTITLMEQVEVAPDAPLHGWHDRLVDTARRLDHEINQAERLRR